MEFKYKLIIFIFILVIVSYVFYFTMAHMSKITRKEMFTDEDDVEHYEEPPVKPSSEPKTNLAYDQRIQVLDTIEKLDIADKTLKGHLMEYVFSEDVLKQLASKTKKEKEEFVEDTYKNMATAMPSETFDQPAKDSVKEPPKQEAPPNPIHSIIPEIGKKIDQAIGYLKNVEVSLSDIKNISVPPKETYRQEKVVEKFTQEGVVDGYENVRGYALYN